MLKISTVINTIKSRKEREEDEIEYEKDHLFNTYTLVLVFILICNIILNLFIDQLLYAIIFFGLTIFLFITLLIPNRIRFNRLNLMSIFFFLGIIVFLCDIASGKGAMSYLSYISLTTAVGYFFNYQTDKPIIFSLISLYIILFLINILTGYTLFPFLHQNLTPEKEMYINIYKVLEVSVFAFLGIYFTNRRERILVKYFMEKERLNEMIKKTDKLVFTEDLYQIAINGNTLFIPYFKSQFPDFFDNMLKSHSNIISSELKICALMKLNFTTKEIARATNSTVRAIENKKYRIRKKLNISTETDINVYIINNF
ncbi:helix-turn-helix transcriptional regulator [Chryseobacterium sp. CBo1]|uniref:helix-turn-helix transcriptional regulator n=1 Tax=Chryseobacterium sp. CBo1 TaxID=1869230 RepID=UPI000A8C2DDB|nr:hypothetical protein [Chryseobacterium sp. CBo1]